MDRWNSEISSLRQKCEELEVKYKEMEEKHKEVQEKCKEMEKMHQEVSSSVQLIMPELKKSLGKLQNQQTSKNKDVDNKLSESTQNVIQVSKGPLKSQDLQRFLIEDVFSQRRRKTLTVIQKYSNDALGVRNQLLQVLRQVEANMKHRKAQEKLDINFIKKIKSLEKKIGEEHAKAMQSSKGQKNSKPNRKVKEPPIKKQAVKSKKNNTPDAVNLQVNKESKKVKQQMNSTQTVKNSRKRKREPDTDSCSSQEIADRYNHQESAASSSSQDSAGSYSSQESADSCISQESAESCSSQDSADSCTSQGSTVRQLTRNLSKKLRIDSAEETDSMSEDDRITVTSHSRRKKKKTWETSDSGLGKDDSSDSENELTMIEKSLFV